MRMRRAKITVVGAGFVGSTCAHGILTRGLGDVVLLDVKEDTATGKALDMMQSVPLMEGDGTVIGTSDYKKIQNSEVVVITAGKPRQEGMSRDDLRNLNARVVESICKAVRQEAPEAFVIVVTNPLDVMTYLAWRVLGFKKNQVMGMAGVLDSVRFRTFVAQKLKVSVRDVQAFVLGGHGDTMVPFPRLCQVGGLPLTHWMKEGEIHSLVDRARKGGKEIISYLKTSSAYYAPAFSVVEMVEAVLKDQKRVLPCSACLKGEFGVRDLFMGVPCVLGKSGVERIVEFSLTESEKALFDQSVSAVRSQVEQLSFS